MADTQTTQQGNTPVFQYPNRNIVITGERVARMVQTTVRVSRIEQRFIQLSMARPAQSDAARRAMERFNQASTVFEAELAQIEKEMENASRAGQERRGSNSGGGSKGSRTEKRQTLTRDQGNANRNEQPQKPARTDQQKPQQNPPQASGKNQPSQGKQTAGNEQSPSGQQPTKRQQREARAAAGTGKPVTDAAAAPTPAPAQKPQDPAQQAPAAQASQQPAATPTAAPAALASL